MKVIWPMLKLSGIFQLIMGKPGKKEQPEQKKRKEESEEEEVEDEVDEGDEGDFEEEGDSDDYDMLDPELSDRDQEILEKIEEEIVNVDEPVKLTWAAIHKLKEEEKKINEQMDQEMRKIQQKYDVLRLPLSKKMARIASGEPVQKQLYTQHELTKNLSVNKHKPKAIPEFWQKCLQSFVVSCQTDAKILQSCTKLECEETRKQEEDEITIQVLFQFGKNEIFENKELKFVVQRKGEEYTVKEKTALKLKIPLTDKDEDSFFIEIFHSEIPAQGLFDAGQNLQRAYNNSVFYYFFEPRVGVDGQNDIEEGEGEEEEEEDEDSEEEIKAVKKKPGKTQEDKKGAVEKPECKNQ